MLDRMNETPGARFLFLLACLVIVVGGLKLAAPLLLPFALALFLAILTLPIMLWLQRHRVPAPLAILLAVLVDLSIFGLLVLLASQSVTEFQARLPIYIIRFGNLWDEWVLRIQGSELPLGGLLSSSSELIDPARIVNLAGSTLQGIVGFLSSTFVVVLIMVFILSEATIFPRKFRAILGPSAGGRRLNKITREIQTYLGIKTLVSLATGLFIGLFAWVMGLDFPVLLGLVGFVLNYVPTIGSILASFPAILLALIQYGLGSVVGVGLGYLAINLIFGNIIEPSLMGRRLGLSTLVVVLSLLFWAWVWGPVGMLLSVPLTMVVKIMLENTQDLRWVAMLLDKGVPETWPPEAVSGPIEGLAPPPAPAPSAGDPDSDAARGAARSAPARSGPPDHARITE